MPARRDLGESDVHAIREQIERGDVLAIVGAGISIRATGGEPRSGGHPVASWIGLLHHGVEYCERSLRSLDSDWGVHARGFIGLGGKNMLRAADAISDELNAPTGGDFRAWLRESIGSLSVVEPDVIRALWALKIPIATTNYDSLIEQVTGLPPVTWRQDNEVERILRGSKEAILHLHGHWEDSESVILGVSSYDRVRDDAHARAMLFASRAVKTLLFVGVGDGMHDPNFSALMEWSRAAFHGSEQRHYRLSLDDEAASLQAQHHPDERIRVVGYGPEYKDMAGFLKRLEPSASARRPSAAPPGSKLPLEPVCFGRKTPLRDLTRSLTQSRPKPVPVLGGPGIGKTTLILAALHDAKVVKRFGPRRYFARCETAKTRADMVALIAEALGLAIGPDPEDQVLNELRRERALLILDDYQVPWDANPGPTQEFLWTLSAIEGLALVVSIRLLEWPPGEWSQPISVGPLSLVAARQLFLHVTKRADFGEDPLLDNLMRAVDCVPLAVTLLGYSARLEPNLSYVWKQWKDRTTALLTGPLSGDHRLTNAEISIDVSLSRPPIKDSPESLRLLSILGVLPNGMEWGDLDEVLPACGVPALRSLRSAGLAVDEPGRVRLLGPIREFVGKTRKPSEADFDRVADYYMGLVARCARAIQEGADDPSPVERLVVESANLDIILRRELKPPVTERLIRAARTLDDLIRVSPLASARTLELAEKRVDEDAYMHALAKAYVTGIKGFKLFLDKQYEESKKLLTSALSMFRAAEFDLGVADCFLRLGMLARVTGDDGSAWDCFTQARSLYRKTGVGMWELESLIYLIHLARRGRRSQETRALGVELLSMAEWDDELYPVYLLKMIHKTHEKLSDDPSDPCHRRHAQAAREVRDRMKHRR